MFWRYIYLCGFFKIYIYQIVVVLQTIHLSFFMHLSFFLKRISVAYHCVCCFISSITFFFLKKILPIFVFALLYLLLLCFFECWSLIVMVWVLFQLLGFLFFGTCVSYCFWFLNIYLSFFFNIHPSIILFVSTN